MMNADFRSMAEAEIYMDAIIKLLGVTTPQEATMRVAALINATPEKIREVSGV